MDAQHFLDVVDQQADSFVDGFEKQSIFRTAGALRSFLGRVAKSGADDGLIKQISSLLKDPEAKRHLIQKLHRSGVEPVSGAIATKGDELQSLIQKLEQQAAKGKYQDYLPALAKKDIAAKQKALSAAKSTPIPKVTPKPTPAPAPTPKPTPAPAPTPKPTSAPASAPKQTPTPTTSTKPNVEFKRPFRLQEVQTPKPKEKSKRNVFAKTVPEEAQQLKQQQKELKRQAKKRTKLFRKARRSVESPRKKKKLRQEAIKAEKALQVEVAHSKSQIQELEQQLRDLNLKKATGNFGPVDVEMENILKQRIKDHQSFLNTNPLTGGKSGGKGGGKGDGGKKNKGSGVPVTGGSAPVTGGKPQTTSGAATTTSEPASTVAGDVSPTQNQTLQNTINIPEPLPGVGQKVLGGLEGGWNALASPVDKALGTRLTGANWGPLALGAGGLYGGARLLGVGDNNPQQYIPPQPRMMNVNMFPKMNRYNPYKSLDKIASVPEALTKSYLKFMKNVSQKPMEPADVAEITKDSPKPKIKLKNPETKRKRKVEIDTPNIEENPVKKILRKLRQVLKYHTLEKESSDMASMFGAKKELRDLMRENHIKVKNGMVEITPPASGLIHKMTYEEFSDALTEDR